MLVKGVVIRNSNNNSGLETHISPLEIGYEETSGNSPGSAGTADNPWEMGLGIPPTGDKSDRCSEYRVRDSVTC